MRKKTVYIALPLTHVKTEAEKNEIRWFVKWLQQTFDVELLHWAFDIEKWQSEPVENIYDFDSERVLRADLLLVLYLTNDGSDGRGGEVVLRTKAGKPILAFAREGVKVGLFSVDCLKKAGVVIRPFTDFKDLEPFIKAALSSL